MRRKIIILSIILFTQYLYSQEQGFFWNLGKTNINYDIMHNGFNGEISLIEINLVLKSNIFFGISAIKVAANEDAKLFYSIFPFEIGYQMRLFEGDFFNFKLLFYNRIEWQYRHFDTIFSKNSWFYDSIGVKLVVFSIVDSFRYNCNFVSLFSEYTSKKEWKIGITVDIIVSAVIVGALMVGGVKSSAEEEWNKLK